MFRLFNFFWLIFDNCQTLDKEIGSSKKANGFYNLTGMLGFLSIGFIITIVASFAIVYFDNHRPPAELRLYNVENSKTMYVNTYDDILPNSEKVGKWVQNIIPRLFKYDFLNVDKNLPLDEFRKQLQQKLQARLDWYNKQRDNLKTNANLDNKKQKDGYQVMLAQDERVASYKNDAIQNLIYSSVKQKPELYLNLYPSEQLERLLVKVDNGRLDLIPVVKLNHITQEYTGNMSSNDKYQFIEEIKVELTNALDKLKTKEDEELSALVQLKEHTQARIDKIDAIIDKIKDAGDISTDDFQQSLLDKLITEKREINVSLQSTVAKIATVKQKYADLMVKARNDAGVKIADKLIRKE